MHPGLTDARRRALDKLLNRYLDLEPAERAEFLEKCRQRYPRLSRWFVRLAGESRTATSLLTMAPEALAGQVLETIDPAPAPELEPDTRLGPWRIVRSVGAGGMGRVYRGERADGAFEMDVAVKLINSKRAALAEQLARECRLLARLDHPAITRLVDAGLTEQGEPYLVMEWVEGIDLDDWLADTRPGLRRRLQVFCEIAAAVAHAHQRLIVHGDIKPGNVRIRSDGQVKLMDFGVASLLGESDEHSAGFHAMTPAFAAPEQRAREPVSTRSDVWSLGALLHVMLVGRLTEGDRPGFDPSACDGLERGEELAAIVARACAADPEARYESALALADDIVRYLEDRPVAALPLGRVARLRKFARRNRLAVAAGVGVSVALVAATVISTSLYFRAETERARAAAHAAELELVVGFQEDQLADIDTAVMGVSLREAVFEGQRDYLHERGHRPDDLDAAMAELQRQLAGVNFSNVALRWLEENVLAETVAGIREKFADRPLVRARLLQSVASTMRNLALYDQAWPLQSEALEIRQRELGETHPDTLDSISSAGLLLRSQGRLAEAEEYTRQALEGRRLVLGEDHPDTLQSISNLGVLLRHQGRLADAEPYYREALHGRQQVLGEEDPDTLASMSNYGVLLVAMGRLDEAEELMYQALEARRRVLGDDDRATLQSINNMGVLLRHQERYAEAEAYYREALERSRRVRGDRHPSTLDIFNNIGVALDRQDRLDEAAEYYQVALTGSRQLLGNEHPATLASIYNLGRVRREQGRLDEALALIGEALDRAEQELPEDHWHTAVFRAGYGKTLAALEQHAKAEPHLLAAHERAAQVLGAAHDRTVEMTGDLVQFYRDWHRLAPDEGHDRQKAQWLARLDSGGDDQQDREVNGE